MIKFNRKIVSVVLSLTVIVWLAGTNVFQAKAATVEELQAQIAALLAQIQALQAQLGQTTGGTGTSCSFTRDLTVGSKGDDVKCLQKWLNGNGYEVAESGAGSPGNESTYFGNLTKAAVAKYQVAKGITPAAGYFGPKTRASLGGGTGGGGVVIPPPGTGLSLSVAADNPMSASVPKGATAIPFLKFNVAGSGTITSLIFKRVGVGATTDFVSGGVNLYDGTQRLTSGKTINSTDHTVTFPNLNLAISGSKELALVANTTSSATAGDVNGFDLIDAQGSVTVSGVPLHGNAMTIGGATVGTVTVDNGSAPSNPNIGAVQAEVLQLKLTAGTAEDINVNRVALYQGGSVNNTYLTNFKMSYGGAVVATAAGVGANNLVTFNFTSPFSILKGQTKTFDITADISGAARSSDTIILYVDNASDIVASGATYGYTVTPDITAIDTTGESNTLTLQGANITINFTGPVAGDIALNGQDVPLFQFNFVSKNNIEIRNFRFSASTTQQTGTSGTFNDFKLKDATTGATLTSATSVTTSSAVTFTDTIDVAANQTKTFVITADIPSTDAASDAVTVRLLAFSTNDIRNLDNNTYVTPSTDISPNADITGNAQTVKAPAIDTELAASPGSQTLVRGVQAAPLVGFNFRADSDDIKLTQLKVYASSTSGTLTTGEIQNLGLYDGDTRLGDLKGLDSSLTATFTNLNLTIPKNTTKLLTVKGNIATDATNGDKYYVYINALTDISAYDTQGNSASKTGVTANSGASVVMTITTSGDVTVITRDTADNKGIVIAGQEQTLGNYDFTAANEAMTVKNMDILVNDSNSSTATTTATGNDVPFIRLYDGSTLLPGGSSCLVGGIQYTSCFSVPISGASSSIVLIRNLGWNIPANGTKTLTVKGLVDDIGFNGVGARSGDNLYATIMAENFKASGQTADDTTITAAQGIQKVILKTQPVLSKLTDSSLKLSGVSNLGVFKFRIAADQAGTVEWKKIRFAVTMTGATMSAVSTSNTSLDNITSGNVGLTLSTLYSGSATSTTGQTSIQGGNTGYVSLELSTPQRIAAGSYADYLLHLGFANLVTSPGAALAISLDNTGETSFLSGTWYAGVGTQGAVAVSGYPAFVWSDFSSSSHATSTGDWLNASQPFIKTFGDTWSITN